MQKWALLFGWIPSAVLLAFFDLSPEHPEVTRMAAVALLMAIWWIFEAIPLAATALLPIVLFPFLGIMKGKVVAPIYFNYIIFLFIGGFMVALAMERWGLHRRMALRIILLVGVSPRRLILGFMVATAFISMWISNTATTMMMIPIALAVILKMEESFGKKVVKKWTVGVLLGIAYAASIGGTATLIGTPPNLSFVRILGIYFPEHPELSFAQWFTFGLPLSVLFLGVVWWLLSWWHCPRGVKLKADVAVFRGEYRKLGRMSFEEWVILVDFVMLAFLWLTRSGITIGTLELPGWAQLVGLNGLVDDGTVAMMMALVLFVVPSRRSPSGRVMDWKTAVKIPWGIVLLFGGGFALASGFKESGLSLWLGTQLEGLGVLPAPVIVFSTCGLLTFLTELTSNTATTEMILPIIGSLAIAIKVNPLLLMIPATLSASCAFMLPVATPPNAIIFGTGRIRIAEMARVGIFINFLGMLIITLAMFLLGTLIFGIDIAQFPTWASGAP